MRRSASHRYTATLTVTLLVRPLVGLCAGLLVGLCPGTVRAQSRVRLGEPSCDRLPFDPASVRRLVALELRLTGAELCPDSGPCEPDAAVAYELEPCALGATDFVFEVMDPLGDRRELVSMADVPLGALPRAIALGLVESLRVDSASGEPALEASEAARPPADAAAEVPNEMPARAPDVSELSHGPRAPPSARADEPSAEPPARTRQIRFGVHAVLQNTPDTGALLFGARLYVELPIADLPLILRADIAAGVGPAAGEVVLGALDGGLTLSIWARATDELGLRFGPRLWLGYLGWFSPGDVTRETKLEVLFGLGIRLGIDLRLTDDVDVVVEAGVGSHVHGAQLSRDTVRTGLVGAYWALEAGLAFD